MKINGEKLNVKRYSLKENTLNVNVGRQAEYLVEKFEKLGCSDASLCYFFFRKCFNHLSEDTIWSIYESATQNPKIHSPIRYFIGACRNQMNK